MGSQAIRLKLKSFDHRILDKAVSDIQLILNDGLLSVIPLPNKRKKFTILTSPHVHKDARDQYEIICHTRMISINPSSDKMNDLMKLELPYGVDVCPISS